MNGKTIDLYLILMPLISPDKLNSAHKILFIAHLAIGDFTYLQNFFKAFKTAHPHLQIDLWIDEVRRTSDETKWASLANYSLYDWTAHCGFFNHIYRQTYSPALYQQSIQQAQAQQYPIVVSIATLRAHNYAKLARQIAGDALVIGIKNKTKWYAPWQNLTYKQLDKHFAPFKAPASGYHITDVYADWFKQLCGLEVSIKARFPFVDIPEQWQIAAHTQLQTWGVDVAKNADERSKVIFINTFAKTKKRCWSLNQAAQLIQIMRTLPAWQNSVFIVNAMPSEFDNARAVFAQFNLKNTPVFSANDNFYQLPALLACCDLIISVETAVMHLANAVHVPVVALMRQKNPEWVPFDTQNSMVIKTKNRREWVDAIAPQTVIDAIQSRQIATKSNVNK